jgi:hypothetical protein
MDPATMPRVGSYLKAHAIAMPAAFCMTMKTEARATKINSGRPLKISSARLEPKQRAAKK